MGDSFTQEGDVNKKATVKREKTAKVADILPVPETTVVADAPVQPVWRCPYCGVGMGAGIYRCGFCDADRAKP